MSAENSENPDPHSRNCGDVTNSSDPDQHLECSSGAGSRLEDERADLEDFEVEDACETVTSYKCRYCSLLCEDKTLLLAHVRDRHLGGGKRQRNKSIGLNEANNTPQNDIGGNEFDFSKVKTHKREIGKEESPQIPSIPPTPDAFCLMSDDEDDEVQLISETPVDPYPDPLVLDMDDVFLCAECDIVFASKDLCGRHMHVVHGLTQFSSEFIQEVIVSRRRALGEGEDEESRNTEGCDTNTPDIETDAELDDGRKRTRTNVRPPKTLTLEDGAVVPKRFRVSKTLTFSCPNSHCKAKYKAEEIMKLHARCHYRSGGGEDEGVNVKRNGNGPSGSAKGTDGEGHADTDDEADRNGGRQMSATEEESRCASQNPNTDNKYKFQCCLCEGTLPKLFMKWSNCASHLWREHQVDCELYACSICKKFKNYFITKVKEHERLHRPEANYLCNVCNKKFKQRHQLINHKKFHKDNATRLPPPEESRWYTPKECPICKRVLSDAKCLKKHISAVHNRLKPYSCNICGHMTARKAELKLHVRQHTGEKPFQCSTCPFATGDHNSLRKHKLRHGDLRPYSCPYCQYSCIQSSAFKKHMVSLHPDQEVVFSCEICPLTTVSESAFVSHQKDHEEGRIPARTESRNIESETTNSSSLPASNENESDSGNEYPEIGIRVFGRKRRLLRKPKSPQKPRWLEDDSVDVIDTGGVTIPASPPAVINNSGNTDIGHPGTSSEVNGAPEPPERSISVLGNKGPHVDLITVNLSDIA